MAIDEALPVLDGVPVDEEGLFGGTLITFPGSGGLGRTLAPEIDTGQHRVQGHVSIRIVRAQRRSEYGIEDAEPGIDYEPIPGGEVALPIPAFEFTVVEEYPKDYPPRIVDAEQAATFDRGFVVESLTIGQDPDTFRDRRRLFAEMLVLAPTIAVAGEITFTGTEPAWERRGRFLATPTTVDSGGHVGRKRVQSEEGQYFSVRARYRLSAELATRIRAGQTVQCELRTTQAAALEAGAPAYLDLSLQRSCILTEAHEDAAARHKRFLKFEASAIEWSELFNAEHGIDHDLTQSDVQTLIELYEAWGKPEKAAEWRAKLPTTQPANESSERVAD